MTSRQFDLPAPAKTERTPALQLSPKKVIMWQG